MSGSEMRAARISLRSLKENVDSALRTDKICKPLIHQLTRLLGFRMENISCGETYNNKVPDSDGAGCAGKSARPLIQPLVEQK